MHLLPGIVFRLLETFESDELLINNYIFIILINIINILSTNFQMKFFQRPV